ncbi:MAG: CbtA family protein [Bauldia sp.]|nr:CbtA family protein [Bauldia sp.]
MFRNIVFSAFGAGLAACLIVSLVQIFTTQPLILHAEVYEEAGGGHEHAAPVAGAAEETAHDEEEEWAPGEGFERVFYTVLANLLMGVSVSLVLVGAMALKGDAVDARTGLFWGIGGFLAVSLLPGLGLPPELPGTEAADLGARQAWWLATAAASAAGLAALAFGRQWGWKAGGIALIVAPHLIGAPEAPTLEAAYPAVLAGEFVIASLVASAVLWAAAGFFGGWLHQRLSQAA